MNTPKVPISWGELFDKITILQIKLDTLTSKKALENVEREHKQLQAIFIRFFSENAQANQLLVDLKPINQHLWDIEDKIRECERNNAFDTTFIELARSVYITNDKRAQLKKDINLHTGSTYVEEKSYENYN